MGKKTDIIILGIESSCDDTAAAIIRNDLIISNEVSGQAIHMAYGGVVPELASRAHQQNIIPVVDLAIKKAGITINDISAVAFTRGPGLLGSLLVGTSFAKGAGVREGRDHTIYSILDGIVKYSKKMGKKVISVVSK